MHDTHPTTTGQHRPAPHGHRGTSERGCSDTWARYMQDLNEIRSAFPNWPSELEVAKAGSKWRLMAQAFFYAAIVLDEESTSSHQAMHAEDGKPIQVDLLMRQQTYIPAVFCLAFSLELGVKGALVEQGKLEGMADGEQLPFARHDISEMARGIEDFIVDEETKRVLAWASSVIRDGKYPVSKTPSDTESGVRVARQFSDLLNEAEPVYRRLRAVRRRD
jgi:hypothetical protein